VHLYYKSDSVPLASLSRVVDALRESTATLLSVSDRARVLSDDISVIVWDSAYRMSVASHDIAVVIWAHNFPERVAAVDTIAATIAKVIQPLISTEYSFFVWVL